MVNVRDDRPAAPPALPAPRISFRALRLSVGHGRYRGILLSATSLLIAFFIWQLLSTFIFNPFLIPPPVEVIRTAIPMLMSGEILADVSISMVRVLVGFISGSLSGSCSASCWGEYAFFTSCSTPSWSCFAISRPPQ
jgi:ABC-type nitrate/sulfonate/bicarbonate transport system permease component